MDEMLTKKELANILRDAISRDYPLVEGGWEWALVAIAGSLDPPPEKKKCRHRFNTIILTNPAKYKCIDCGEVTAFPPEQEKCEHSKEILSGWEPLDKEPYWRCGECSQTFGREEGEALIDALWSGQVKPKPDPPKSECDHDYRLSVTRNGVVTLRFCEICGRTERRDGPSGDWAQIFAPPDSIEQSAPKCGHDWYTKRLPYPYGSFRRCWVCHTVQVQRKAGDDWESDTSSAYAPFVLSPNGDCRGR